MSATGIIKRVEQEGLRLETKDGKLKVLAPNGRHVPDSLIPQLKTYKQEIIETLKEREAEAIRQALVRLQLNETNVIRLYSETCKGEFLIVRDENTLKNLEGVYNVDCPTFTRAELKELLGKDKETVEKVYMVKKAFKGSKVVKTHKTVAITEEV